MMLSIENAGPKHTAVKYCKKLGNPSFRKKEGKLLLEGIHLIREALNENVFFEALFFSENFLSDHRYEKLISFLVSHKEIENYYMVSNRVLKNIAHTQNPQGILAICRLPKYVLRDCFLSASPFLLILDGLRDPGNMGNIIRTAAGAGINGVMCLPGSVDLSNLKLLRASSGAVFRIPVFYLDEGKDLFSLLNRHKVSLVGTDPHQGILYSEADLTGPTALVIGNESAGLHANLKEILNFSVRIPLKKAESLNAAAAASIIVFEALRQRGFNIV